MKKESDLKTYQTILVNMDQLADEKYLMHIASLSSGTKLDSIYLVFVTETEPRRELNDVESLKGAFKLINLLKSANLEILVGHCSSDLIIWKAAGADSCASGKFFNLRRFSKSRWDEPSSGGGQLPYLFEQSILTFLRESDLLRVKNINLISDATAENPFFNKIVEKIESEEESKRGPWLALSWRFYMYWFQDTEAKLSSENALVDAKNMLKSGDANWAKLEDEDVLMEERPNDGRWVRTWRRALIEAPKELGPS